MEQMSRYLAGASRRMSGQFTQAAYELSWRARYARRICLAGWDTLVHPRRMAGPEAEDTKWNRPLARGQAKLEAYAKPQAKATQKYKAIQEKHKAKRKKFWAELNENPRRALDEAVRDQLYGRPPRETANWGPALKLTPEEAKAVIPEETEEDIQR